MTIGWRISRRSEWANDQPSVQRESDVILWAVRGAIYNAAVNRATTNQLTLAGMLISCQVSFSKQVLEKQHLRLPARQVIVLPLPLPLAGDFVMQAKRQWTRTDNTRTIKVDLIWRDWELNKRLLLLCSENEKLLSVVRLIRRNKHKGGCLQVLELMRCNKFQVRHRRNTRWLAICFLLHFTSLAGCLRHTLAILLKIQESNLVFEPKAWRFIGWVHCRHYYFNSLIQVDFPSLLMV